MKTMKRIYCIWILIALVGTSCSNSETTNNKKANGKDTVSQKTIEVVGKELAAGVIELPKNQVCMVNDAFKTSEQIPVVVHGKTYYGCCQGCVDALKTNELARTTTDLATGESVDKATGIVILKPGSDEQVLYFANVVNAVKYVKGEAYVAKYLKDLDGNQSKISTE